MRIDVAICTWNRAALLAKTLERFLELQIPRNIDWQLLIVNNNSTDKTPDVMRAFSTQLPLRAIFEPHPGLSNARNRAVRETTADYLVWTDDDVLVDPDWLAAYARAFARWPNAGFFGGPVEPWFEGTPPRWLAEHWRHVAMAFAVRQFGDTAFQFDKTRVPYGANCAFKADVQRRYDYNPALGRRPGSSMSGEEAAVMRKMMTEGHTGWWVPDAKVVHFIPHDRQSVQYLRKIFGGQGEAETRWRKFTGTPRIFGVPLPLVKSALRAEARYRRSRLTESADVWLFRLIEAAKVWGNVRGVARLR
jgi:glycosyltransferase involved in cell wall biosynthesis